MCTFVCVCPAGYLEQHPAWDQDRVFSAALSLFLMQNGESDRRTSRVYLDTLFNYTPIAPSKALPRTA
ncbi:DUF2811 domain-containing protein [Leptothoe sp. PORK10 BA2]|uniref:DUF2811 domain-containing protein n=1 Tax=Leptothoe sp. PORK10 BA2 TaxID=3110254 RepID=UPI002B1EC6E9|nr:DUF2811 domain-containing protein [Leptothoe sp. PORK10 BA2]